MATDYISREAAIEAMCRLCSDTTRDKCRIADICNHVCRLEAVPAADVIEKASGLIGEFPSVDVRENKRGKWKAKDFHTVACSECGFDMDIMTVDDHVLNHANYCPNCGADMREDGG